MWKDEKPCIVADSTIMNKSGDRPPSTYSMKIQSISQLKTLFSAHDAYKSRTFASGKYNWKLVIYPEGNKNDNGSGFISMYVELDNTNPTSTVLAYVTFFVYNKKENKYFTIQDVEGKQFNALRPVWGVPQVFPLNTFNDPKNGYVFEGDQCEFGVDVIVPLTNWEIVSFTQKPLYPKFSWTLKKFSKLKELCYASDKFLVGGRNWVLKLHPKGDSTKYCKSLSIYLHLADNATMKAGEEIYAQADMRILDPYGHSHVTGKVSSWFHISGEGWGWSEFVSLAKLREAYLDKEGSLKIEIEFNVVSNTKYSS